MLRLESSPCTCSVSAPTLSCSPGPCLLSLGHSLLVKIHHTLLVCSFLTKVFAFPQPPLNTRHSITFRKVLWAPVTVLVSADLRQGLQTQSKLFSQEQQYQSCWSWLSGRRCLTPPGPPPATLAISSFPLPTVSHTHSNFLGLL